MGSDALGVHAIIQHEIRQRRRVWIMGRFSYLMLKEERRLFYTLFSKRIQSPYHSDLYDLLLSHRLASNMTHLLFIAESNIILISLIEEEDE